MEKAHPFAFIFPLKRRRSPPVETGDSKGGVSSSIGKGTRVSVFGLINVLLESTSLRTCAILEALSCGDSRRPQKVSTEQRLRFPNRRRGRGLYSSPLPHQCRTKRAQSQQILYSHSDLFPPMRRVRIHTVEVHPKLLLVLQSTS